MKRICLNFFHKNNNAHWPNDCSTKSLKSHQQKKRNENKSETLQMADIFRDWTTGDLFDVVRVRIPLATKFVPKNDASSGIRTRELGFELNPVPLSELMDAKNRRILVSGWIRTREFVVKRVSSQ